MTGPVIGMSPEVIAHHANLHYAQCESVGACERPCPCGNAIAVVCGTCSRPVFVVCRPDQPLCRHAAELADLSHDNWWGAAT